VSILRLKQNRKRMAKNMNMPLSLEWAIITNGLEERTGEKDNVFHLQLPGYRLFPMDQEIDIMRQEESEHIGTAIITELKWAEEQTTIIYQLTSLYSVN